MAFDDDSLGSDKALDEQKTVNKRLIANVKLLAFNSDLMIDYTFIK